MFLCFKVFIQPQDLGKYKTLIGLTHLVGFSELEPSRDGLVHCCHEEMDVMDHLASLHE